MQATATSYIPVYFPSIDFRTKQQKTVLYDTQTKTFHRNDERHTFICEAITSQPIPRNGYLANGSNYLPE